MAPLKKNCAPPPEKILDTSLVGTNYLRVFVSIYRANDYKLKFIRERELYNDITGKSPSRHEEKDDSLHAGVVDPASLDRLPGMWSFCSFYTLSS